MAKNILEATFMKDFIKVTHDMWHKGWHERNGGNVSYRLTTEEVDKYVDTNSGSRSVELFRAIPELSCEVFLVTSAGKYFRNIILDPEENLGIIEIDEMGKSYRIWWGFLDNGLPTSELPAHLLSHASRMKATDDQCRVVLHSHTTNLIALSNVLKLDTATFTRTLWQMHTECIVVFPDGIGVLPWMMPGSDEIGEATAELMKTHSLVLWPFHGLFSTGVTLDEAFGLIDTAESAAEIMVKSLAMGGAKKTITKSQLLALATTFGVTPLDGIL